MGLKMGLKIGKKAKAVVQNPFRPNYGLENQRRYTVCRITDCSGKMAMLSFMEDLPVRIDGDGEPQFWKEFEEVIPKADRYYDKDLEVWQTRIEHLETVIQLALDYFEDVKVERGGKIEKLKSPTRTDLLNPGVVK